MVAKYNFFLINVKIAAKKMNIFKFIAYFIMNVVVITLKNCYKVIKFHIPLLFTKNVFILINLSKITALNFKISFKLYLTIFASI